MITACGPLIENGFQNGFSLFFLPSLPLRLHSPASINTVLHPFLSSPLSWQKGGNIGRTGREMGGGGGRNGAWRENHPSALCHTYDSRVIRPINEIIDHLMGLIINCFFTLSGPVSSSSSLLLLLRTFYPLIHLTGEIRKHEQEHPDCSQR